MWRATEINDLPDAARSGGGIRSSPVPLHRSEAFGQERFILTQFNIADPCQHFCGNGVGSGSGQIGFLWQNAGSLDFFHRFGRVRQGRNSDDLCQTICGF